MEDQKSLSLAKIIYRTPQVGGAISLVKEEDNFNQNYIIHRVKLDPIEVSSRGRDEVLKALSGGSRFVQLGEYTIMVNTITSIEPLYMKNKRNHELLEAKKKELGMK